ncbi:hypothetical protein FB451DRAFT_1518596 [Mycena latifolia]|nr:hypothetical protein FB451DRAFT_1518596 [Mycena latifolia]
MAPVSIASPPVTTITSVPLTVPANVNAPPLCALCLPFTPPPRTAAFALPPPPTTVVSGASHAARIQATCSLTSHHELRPLLTLTEMKRGLSSKVKIRSGPVFGRRGPKARIMKMGQSAEEQARSDKEYNDQISQMSFLQREELLKDAPMPDFEHDGSFDIGANIGGTDTDSDSAWSDTDDPMDTDEPGFLTLPPGEEALLQSHAGGEAIFQQMWDKAKPGCAFLGIHL